ncbi:unnamed protein product [Owenia fusiformis]|uniref:Uncharacterized protein n=1 Tax=Owenia fusiformis TaxID=6347 RepID=A0A8J1Y1G9_OWEFU|nr:unnamed protein product [Owenia fusiformis]
MFRDKQELEMGQWLHRHPTKQLMSKMISYVTMVLMVTMTTLIAGQKCPVTKHDVLDFTKELGDLNFGCTGQVTKLLCCTSGFTQLTWYRVDVNSKQWLEYPFGKDPDTIELHSREDGNQTLSIMRSNSVTDSTQYKCIATDGKKNISNTWDLKIQGCEDWSKPPLVTIPKSTVRKNYHKCSNVGGNVTLWCGAFMGNPGQLGYNYGIWNKVRPNGTSFPLSNNPRFNMTNLSRDASYLELRLYIPHVIEEDFGEYFCALQNMNEPSRRVNAILEKCPPKPRPIPWKLYVSIPVACVVGVTILSVAVITWKGEQMKLWYINKFPKIDKTVEKKYDATVVFDEEKDMKLSIKINEKLINLGYKVPFTNEDYLIGGRSTFNDWATMISECRCVIFLVTKSFVKKQIPLRVFQETLATPPGPIICITEGKIRKEDILDDFQESFSKSLKAGTKLCLPTMDKLDKATRFWCRLQNNMPCKLLLVQKARELKQKKKLRKRGQQPSSSSQHPMLHDDMVEEVVQNGNALGHETVDEVFNTNDNAIGGANGSSANKTHDVIVHVDQDVTKPLIGYSDDVTADVIGGKFDDFIGENGDDLIGGNGDDLIGQKVANEKDDNVTSDLGSSLERTVTI